MAVAEDHPQASGLNKLDESELSPTSLFPLRRRHKDDKTLGSANGKQRFFGEVVIQW
jgi:hypothetical protein